MNPEREAQFLELLEEKTRLLEVIKEKDQMIKLLKQKVDSLVRRVFGTSSEKIDPGQLQWEQILGKAEPSASSEVEIAEGDEKKQSSRGKGKRFRRGKMLEGLPVEEERIEPLEVQADPSQWKQIGEEVTEQLDYQPAVYVRRRIVRPRYVSIKDREKAPVIAPLAGVLQERCMATAAMLAHVVVSKYADHCPLYRQEQILKGRHGVEVTRQTLNDWVKLVAQWVRPIYEKIKAAVMEDGYIQVDETPIRYLDPGRGRTSQGYFWTVHRPGRGTFYQWYPGRGIEGLEQVLAENYQGILQKDGYSVYGAYARNKPIELAGCWAHVRRKFYEAREQDWRMVWVLGQIGYLYEVERELREVRAGPALRAAIRSWRAVPILKRIKRVLESWAEKRRFLPQSGAGLALEYTLKLWASLEVYVKDGRVEIDNNGVENAIRPTAIGKKNWLFVGAEDEGQDSAILYTMIEECRRLGLNAQTYLTEVLKRLPTATNRTVGDLRPEALAGVLGSRNRAEVAKAA